MRWIFDNRSFPFVASCLISVNFCSSSYRLRIFMAFQWRNWDRLHLLDYISFHLRHDRQNSDQINSSWFILSVFIFVSFHLQAYSFEFYLFIFSLKIHHLDFCLSSGHLFGVKFLNELPLIHWIFHHFTTWSHLQ
jgi:hypothetical protein